MKTLEVANRWAQLCREGKNLECVNELYAENVKSQEMPNSPDEVVAGRQNVWDKNKQWLDSVDEIHATHISEPLVAENYFTSKMDFDVTFKEHGRRKMEELGVYEVKDGKIVSERFFYSM